MTPAQRIAGVCFTGALLIAAAVAMGAGCEAPPERRARHLVEQAGGGPTTCVTVQGGGCITVAAPAERLSP